MFKRSHKFLSCKLILASYLMQNSLFQAYVSCGWGISNIGFVMICFGVCNGIAAIFIGNLIKITGRSPVICFALSLHVALIVTLLVWQPASSNKLVFFVIAALWGICDAVWLVQINCEYRGTSVILGTLMNSAKSKVVLRASAPLLLFSDRHSKTTFCQLCLQIQMKSKKTTRRYPQP